MATKMGVLALCLAACGNKEPVGGSSSSSSGSSGGGGGAPGVASGSTSAAPGSAAGAPATASGPIALASVTRDGPRRAGPAKTMMLVGGKLVEVDPDDVYGAPGKGFRGFDSEGRLAPASGAWRLVPDAPPSSGDVVVLVDRGVPAAAVLAALAPLGGRCVGFLARRDRGLATLFPEPCPPAQVPVPGEVQLGVLVHASEFTLTASQLDEIMEIPDPEKLEGELRGYKASAFFAARKDLSIAFHKDATFGEVIEVLDVVHGAGFTAASWVDAEQLEKATRTTRPAGSPTVSILQPNVQGDLTAPIVRRYVKRHTAEIMACYEERLAEKPGLSGTVMLSFQIDKRGKVSTMSSVGLDQGVADCVGAVVKRIEFPQPRNNRNVQVNYPLIFRPAGE